MSAKKAEKTYISRHALFSTRVKILKRFAILKGCFATLLVYVFNADGTVELSWVESA